MRAVHQQRAGIYRRGSSMSVGAAERERAGTDLGDVRYGRRSAGVAIENGSGKYGRRIQAADLPGLGLRAGAALLAAKKRCGVATQGADANSLRRGRKVTQRRAGA